jgi:hypothetical protein
VLSVQLSTDGFRSPKIFGVKKIYPAMFEIPGVVPEPILEQLKEAGSPLGEDGRP